MASGLAGRRPPSCPQWETSMKTLLALASAAALTLAYSVPAQAGGNPQNWGNNNFSNVNVKQNGNGCRNRCFGTQTFNAGVNNGNFNNGNNGFHNGHFNNGNHNGHFKNGHHNGHFKNGHFSNGNVNVKQNGNGCRNRCFGTQTFNAGVNNGNKGKWGH